jgi:hypothetical protein
VRNPKVVNRRIHKEWQAGSVLGRKMEPARK